MPNFKPILFSSFVLIGALVSTSCELINPDETIPSYVHVKDISVETDYAKEGSAQHQISDIWIVHNGNIVATTPIPSTIPILQANNINEIRLYAGIKEGGTSTNRTIYPFFNYATHPMSFIPEQIDTLDGSSIVFNYKETTKFVWMEDFENSTMSIQPIDKSSAPIQLTKKKSEVKEGKASFLVELNKNDTILSVQGFSYFEGTEFNLGSPVYLELSYRNEVNLQIGLAFRADNVVQYATPLLYLKESPDEWKTVYVNLTNEAGLLADKAGLKIYLAAVLPDALETASVYLDNIKLLTFE